MRLIYTSEAKLEITEAGSYYRRISKELAYEFKQRLVSALEDVKRNPETWRKLDEKIPPQALEAVSLRFDISFARNRLY